MIAGYVSVNVYDRAILPRLIHRGMRHERFRPYRERLVSAATGRVLEIGFGSGLNLPLYANATFVIGLDRSSVALGIARRSANGAPVPVNFLEASAEAIPLERESVETVVTAWTLCSIPDVRRALAEVHRVLVPSGRFLFVEHGRSPAPSVARWQDRLTPVWKRIAGGCHLNRPIDRLIEGAGFRVEQLHCDYMAGPKAMTFIYEGCARRG